MHNVLVSLLAGLVGLIVSTSACLAQNYTVLRNFESSSGTVPISGMKLLGSSLYGTTHFGGSSANRGVVFKINTDGSGYTVLHTFTNG